MKILGIETSCDDTGISVVEAKGAKSPSFHILANIVASQIKVHRKYGGVYPAMAKREHETNLPIAVAQALKEAGARTGARTVLAQACAKTVLAIDALAITYGPGLSPCLWVGLNWAKTLAKEWGVPLIPVNHMEGHLLISLFKQRNGNAKCQMPNAKTIFPAIALLVSGGHTQLVLVNGLGKYKILGETRDDAAGECFDKTARILGLPYPGGPAIAAEAAKVAQSLAAKKEAKLQLKLPRPMMHTKDYDFSFSGLKTAVLYDWKSRSKKARESSEYVSEMAKEIQNAIAEALVSKTLRTAHRYSVKAIILGGGVGANTLLRDTLSLEAKKLGVRFLAAPPELCTDNGAMIAVAGYATWLRTKSKNRKHIEANPNLRL